MANTPEILIFKDRFEQPTSVVEKFLRFTKDVFPDLLENGGDFLREGIEADYKHAPELYHASTVISKLRKPDGRGSDMLLLSPGSPTRHEDPMLIHSYFYLNGCDIARTSYKVVCGKLLATTSLESEGGPVQEQYEHYQSVALTLGRTIGFERGRVDMRSIDNTGDDLLITNRYELVGAEEIDALLGLFAPKKM